MSLYNNVPSVLPSGRGVYFPFPDPVTNLAFPGEEQSLAINVHPSNVTLTSLILTFNGQTTTSIPISIIPPPVYFQWNHTLTAPGTFDLAVNLYLGGTSSPNLTFEIYDGSTKLDVVVFNCRTAVGLPVPFGDPVLVGYGDGTGNGGPIQWYTLGRFTFTTTNLSVRVSCPTEEYIDNGSANDLRIADTTGQSVTIVTDVVPPSYASPGCQPNIYNKMVFGHPDQITFTGTWAGDRYSVDPTAVQSALEALSNIGVGNIQCSGNATIATPLKFIFINQLGNSPQNLITTNDNVNMPVIRVAAGGSWPKIKINGGSVISLSQPYWMPHGGMSAIAFFFVPDMPATRYQSVNTNSNSISGNWSNYLDDLFGASGGGYAPTLYRSEDAGATASFAEVPLTQATYRISGTWPASASWSTDVIFTLKNAAGTTLWTYHVDQTKAPSGTGGTGWEIFGNATITQPLGDGLVLTQSNNTTSQMIADTIKFERTSASTELKINSGDTVTYTTGDNWVSTTSGNILGVTDQPLLNLVGKTLFPDLESTQTMGLGYNVPPDTSEVCGHMYTNLMKAGGGLYGTAFDSLGYPTALSYFRAPNSVIFPKVSWQADNKVWPGMLPGDYVLLWDGDTTTDLTIGSNGFTNSVVEYTDKRVITGTTNNRKYYKFDGNGWGVDLSLTITGLNRNPDNSANVNVSNIRIFEGSVDINNPPKYNPTFVNRVSNKKVLRFMDFFGTISGCPVTFADLNRPQGQPGTGDFAVRGAVLDIAQIQQYTGNMFNFLKTEIPFQFTTKTPHGLSTGQQVFIQNYTGPPAQISGTAGTTTYSFTDPKYCFVIDSTNFVIYAGPNGYDTMTNGPIINPAGQVMYQVHCSPLQDAIEICNLANADFYFNTAHTLTQEAIMQAGAYIAANLNPGLKIYHEASNETWNYQGTIYAWACQASVAFGYSNSSTDFVSYTCQLSKNHWQWLRTGLGARASDHIRVLGTQHGNPGITGFLSQYCNSQSPPIVFDAIAVAPYYHNAPSGVNYDNTFGALEDHFDIEQCIDILEMFWIHTNYQYEISYHKNQLVSNGFPADNTIRIIGYEGGPEMLIPPGNIYARYGERQHGILRHPRFWTFFLNSLKIYQNSGLEFFLIYQLAGLDGSAAWATYQGTEQLDYQPGDANQDSIQINDYNNLSYTGARSVVGGAATHWMNLVNSGGGGPSPTPSSYIIIPPINAIVSIPTQIIVIFTEPLTTNTTINISDGLVSGSVTINSGNVYGVIPYTPTTSGNKTLTVNHTGQSITDPTTNLTFFVMDNSVSFVEPEMILEKTAGRKFIGYKGRFDSEEV